MIDFPNAPTLNQQFSAAGATWTWDGVKWAATGQSAPYLPLAGGTLTGALLLAADPTVALGAATKQYADKMLPLAGGTLSGPLVVTLASGSTPITVTGPGVSRALVVNKAASGGVCGIAGQTAGAFRWGVNLGDGNAETGTGNAGSDFSIQRYTDAGVLNDTPLSISRATGQATFSQIATINVASGPATLVLNTPGGAGNPRTIVGQTSAVSRWQLVMGNGAVESGSNVGSDFALQRYNDAGALIDSPLSITRSTGQVTIVQAGNQPLQINGSSQHALINLNKAASGFSNAIQAYRAGAIRWSIVPGNPTAETGSNTGSDFYITNFSDAGSALSNAIAISRATSVVTFAAAIVNGPSDRGLKENIAPLEGALAKVLQLQGVNFNMIDDAAKRKQIGLIAQDVQPIVPEVVQAFGDEGKLALDYPKLTALLVEAVKELAARTGVR
jgi:Chaperone of endosialidase